METVIDYVKRRLREHGPGLWELIAAECGVAKTLPRKIVYGDRENPGVQTLQPLLTYLQELERGTRKLPDPAAKGLEPAGASAAEPATSAEPGIDVPPNQRDPASVETWPVPKPDPQLLKEDVAIDQVGRTIEANVKAAKAAEAAPAGS